jgi:hypothetical protein
VILFVFAGTMEHMKRCPKCDKAKELTEFYSRKDESPHGYCKKCENQYNRDYKAANPEFAERTRAYRREWGRNPDNKRRIRLKRYNLTQAQYGEMLIAQNGVCGICGNLPDPDFHIDHDHNCCPKASQSCGKCVRGLLCNHCNTGISRFGDDPDLLMAAARYLTKWCGVNV